ncbi:MAG: lysylphosphatidylglycerol synthase transmembrane domain-containing protein [Sphaerobacter sp.]|nr:lysylphosphatidylglycerol synthase transmembrane domain-containing protein [Sphaerobacter sp.]
MTGPVAQTSGRVRPRWRGMLLAWGPLLLAAGVLLASGQTRAVARALGGAQLAPTLALLGVGMVLPVVHARRWQIMLRAVAADVPLAEVVDMTVTASLVNYAVPGYAGSPVKGALARQFHDVGFGRSLPTLAAEQALDAAALLLGAVVGMALVWPTDGPARAWLASLVDHSGTVLMISALVLALAAGAGLLAARRYAQRFTERVVASGRMLAGDRARRRPVLLLTAAYWGLNLAAVWLGARAVGLTLAPVALLLLANVPLLVGLVSPLPGGLGLREGAMAAIAAVVGVPVPGIVAAAVLHRGVLVLALPLTLAGARLVARRSRWA